MQSCNIKLTFCDKKLDIHISITRSCYRTVSSVIWEIFSEFLVFRNLFHDTLDKQNIRNEENICEYCKRQRAITTSSLNTC